MVESPMRGFLKSIFGLAKDEPPQDQPTTPPAAEDIQAQQAPSLPLRPSPVAKAPAYAETLAGTLGDKPGSEGQAVRTPTLTEAYLNRKKGRKRHRDSLDDLKRIVACIESRGEVTPGDLALELGMSRSTLTYNLKRLLSVSPNADPYAVGYWQCRALQWTLGGKYLVKTGAGKHVKYRLEVLPNPISPKES